VIDLTGLLPTMQTALRARLGDRIGEYLIPPPVFFALGGEFIDFDPDTSSLTARFPVLEAYLNPYGVLQGGMIAALVDNTIGPLSVLVAPPNVTRHLEMTYKKPITPDLQQVTVTCQLVERTGQQLTFKAKVQDLDGVTLARAKSTHWIIANEGHDG
jgi:uncharacterized protein (TIGR00369 family)